MTTKQKNNAGPDLRVSSEDLEIIVKIAERAHKTTMFRGLGVTGVDTQMDLCAVHNRKPLRLQELLDADAFNFSHDVGGIYRHLNRETGDLEGFFVPRFTKKVGRKL